MRFNRENKLEIQMERVQYDKPVKSRKRTRNVSKRSLIPSQDRCDIQQGERGRQATYEATTLLAWNQRISRNLQMH